MIDALEPGSGFELKTLIGQEWPLDEDPRNFGKWFKAEVLGGRFANVRYNGGKTDNHRIYTRI
ncbi:single-stranded DNA-binding protein [Alloyangia pacifica]|uniref:single-stranded DNA-binding protein n=1 Tax=Alloyangia pacifica TaxID=311180 RepID=UPI0021F61E99|nr:single-stranded DNA-binding protein [Alloyangia pacifica]